MTDDLFYSSPGARLRCPVDHCDRPAMVGKEFCLPHWRQVPIPEQTALYQLSYQLRAEPNNRRAQYGYQLALERAIRSVPVDQYRWG